MSYRDGKTDREHRFIAEEMIGRALMPDEVVHHIDGNKRNNAQNNLTVMTRSEHARIHSKDISRSKPIIQADKDGNQIKQWESARLAGKTLGINATNISACCNGRLKSAGGFLWKFVQVESI
jgi:hypothetical protein